MSASSVEIFDDEEFLKETDGYSFGSVNWLSPINLILGLFTMGLWYIYLIVKSGFTKVEYVITDERIVETKGLFSKSTRQINFDDIVGDIRTEQNVIQSMMDAGDIIFEVQRAEETGGKTGNIGDRERSERQMDIQREEISLKGVREHDDVANTIRRIYRG